MTLVDFCDFGFACTTRAVWCERNTSEETPKYGFSVEALQKWTRSETPIIHDDSKGEEDVDEDGEGRGDQDWDCENDGMKK